MDFEYETTLGEWIQARIESGQDENGWVYASVISSYSEDEYLLGKHPTFMDSADRPFDHLIEKDGWDIPLPFASWMGYRVLDAKPDPYKFDWELVLVKTRTF